MKSDAQRAFGPDLVRCVAGILVLAVHFFLNNGFYGAEIAGPGMLASCIVRMLCMTCVPLFLLLTGYLCVDRKWSAGYYRKLLPVLLTYSLSAAACLAFRLLCEGEELSVYEAVVEFFGYEAAPYGWYVGMYVGLFLLSPFVNAMWHALDDAGKQALLLTAVGLTALPSLTNQAVPIFPDQWTGVYPLTYYVIGAWLKEHPIRARRWVLLAGYLGFAVFFGVRGHIVAAGGAYVALPEDAWGSYALTAESVLLFSALAGCQGRSVPVPARRWVSGIARLSLGMYLVSYIPDRLVYSRLAASVPVPQERILWMPLAVACVVAGSCLLARPLDRAVAGILRLIGRSGERTGN